MNILLISVLAVASLSIFPTKVHGTTEAQEVPRALPVAAATTATDAATTSTATTLTTPTVVAQNDEGESEIWEENNHEVLIRNQRGTKNGADGSVASCKYVKSPWTECDPQSNTRSRTLTLKKGEEGCIPTRTIQKKCKKACRYEKGTWSECTNGEMSRTDKLKSTSEANCQPTRLVNKNCNPTKQKGERKNRPGKNGKDKAHRKSA